MEEFQTSITTYIYSKRYIWGQGGLLDTPQSVHMHVLLITESN